MNGGVLLSQADAALRSKRLPRGTFLALLGAALALAVVLGAAVGSMWLPPARVVRALVEPLGLGGGVTAAEHAVIWSIRAAPSVPRLTSLWAMTSSTPEALKLTLSLGRMLIWTIV